MKFLQIQQLALEKPKEILNHSIVQAVALSAHALPDALLTEHSLILLVLVLPPLNRVQDQIRIIRNFLKRLVQHGCHHAQHRPLRDRVADQIAAMQIKNGRKIQLFSEQAEFCDIGDPFLIRLVGMEIPIQQIRRDFTNFTLVRAIFLYSDTANQPQLLHKPLDSFMIQ